MSTIADALPSGPGQTAPAINVTDLVKTYRYHQKDPGLGGSLKGLLRRHTREQRAVDGVSFAIAPGEIVGFLGPNGAGKTTTLKVLCGLLMPTTGRVDVLGHAPARRAPAYLRRIALVMGQKSMLQWDLPTSETLLLHRELYGLRDAPFRATVSELSAMLEVAPLLRVPVRKLSLGERMKLELLTALVHRPDVLFLDEPTIGLDVVAQERVRDFLRRLNAEHGTTILLTSHYMEDIAALCPRVLVIDRGRLGYDGTLAGLVARMAPQKRLTAVFATPVTSAALLAAIGQATLEPSDDPARIVLSIPREEVAACAAALLRLGDVVDLAIEETPIDAIIRAVFGASAAAGGGR